jgi:hypothetical protein
MAIARQQVGVRQGYRARERRVILEERRTLTKLQWIAAGLLSNAREIRDAIADEIVYATMDTVRVLEWLRYEFGFRGVRRGKRAAHGGEQAPQEATFNAGGRYA